MSINDFFDHTCDIYHIMSAGNKKLGYGLVGETEYVYPDKPDVSDLECHFNQKSSVSSANMNQKEPQNELSIRTKICVPSNTDLRILDKVVFKKANIEYIVVSPPRNVRNNHIYATIEIKGLQKAL